MSGSGTPSARVGRLTLRRCPVCSQNLEELGDSSVQEAHVKLCLEGGAGASPPTAKYLVYRLPAESALIGVECAYCFARFITNRPLTLC
ncbi:hypothetical protein OE88DRAFT_1652296 [Heliocybe sulcata]|uniref:Uncharacterized protein n=1 Tax=Heliocybe sulcata TaxID=5364 RepID=A0A5C3NI88_9AGAM|nr:hypothetical protein OE88DRAFT_1652296 [Heliocybe sulcata]